MKPILLLLVCAFALCFNMIQAAPGSTGASNFQLTIELRDGSRVIGNSLEDTLGFRSAVLGDMKLAWGGIRSIEYTDDTGMARLTATNGDVFTVRLASDAVSVETAFGKTQLPVKLIHSIKVKMLTVSSNPGGVAPGESVARLSIELRDGSHVEAKAVNDTQEFHSTAMGDMKLAWSGIRSIEYATSGTNIAQLTATNGDVYEVEFAAPGVRVETSFGKTELPVKLIRNIKVSAATRWGQLPSGLVALWSGEGDGTDSVGVNNAVLTEVTFAEGKDGQAFSFNGASSHIEIPDNQILDVGAGEGFTVAAWIKPSKVNGIYNVIEWNNYLCAFEIGQYPSDRGVLISSVFDSNQNNHFLRSAPGIIIANVFQHIALTYDKASGIGTLYVNGTIVAQSQLGSFVPLTKGGLRIGYRPGNPGDWTYNRFYTGLMDELAIYNRALSASEIQAICAEENNGELPPPPTPVSSMIGSQFRGSDGVINQ